MRADHEAGADTERDSRRGVALGGVLLERDAALACLHEYAQDAGNGSGRLVLIAGEARPCGLASRRHHPDWSRSTIEPTAGTATRKSVAMPRYTPPDAHFLPVPRPATQPSHGVMLCPQARGQRHDAILAAAIGGQPAAVPQTGPSLWWCCSVRRSSLLNSDRGYAEPAGTPTTRSSTTSVAFSIY